MKIDTAEIEEPKHKEKGKERLFCKREPGRVKQGDLHFLNKE
jgi:hypothetical protein